MSKKMKKEYEASGYIYNDGDVPTCSFCGTTADETIIHSGDYSGEHICESEGCCREYMNNNILTSPFETKEVEIDVCDWCEDEIVNEHFHKLDGEDVCNYCYDDKEDEDDS